MAAAGQDVAAAAWAAAVGPRAALAAGLVLVEAPVAAEPAAPAVVVAEAAASFPACNPQIQRAGSTKWLKYKKGIWAYCLNLFS